MSSEARLAIPTFWRGGFSTAGAMVSLVLAGFVLAQLLGMVVASQRGLIDSNARTDAAGSARHAQLALTRLIRIAGSDPKNVGVQTVDPDPLTRGVFDNIRVWSDYNPPDGDVLDPGEDMTFWLQGDTMYVRAGANGTAEPYLFGVDSLHFRYLNRSGVELTDTAQISSKAVSVELVIRGRGEAHGEPRRQLLLGRVKLRNRG